LTGDGLVAIQLKKPFRDGTVSVEMDPLSLVSRLAASVHPPRFHAVRYGGVLVASYETDNNGTAESLLLDVMDGYGPAVYGSGSQILVDYVRAWQ
jgi:hypothetical protein